MDRSTAQWFAELTSGDEATVVHALHRACPCAGSSETYEKYRIILAGLKKDPRPKVRAVALHLEQDAFEALAVEDEQAAGYVRNRPGGHGSRGGVRRRWLRY